MTRRWMRDTDLYAGQGDRPPVATTAAFTWWVPDDATTAHAFPVGSGWSRSSCREARWSVKARHVTNADPRCAACVTANEGSRRMMTTDLERTLRTSDLALPEPPPDVLDRLEADGHDRNGFCEKCWAEAGRRAAGFTSDTQAGHYLAILAEVRGA